MKRSIAVFLLLCGVVTVWAQGEIKGSVVDAITAQPISETTVSIEGTNITDQTDQEGTFHIKGDLPQGDQILRITKIGYNTKRFPIVIQGSSSLILDNILLDVDIATEQQQIGVISLSDNEITGDNDDLGNFNISGLLSASRDVFLSAAAFDFSATFFRPRGLDNANGKVLINGIEQNKQFNGRPQWSDWGGINDLQRNQEFAQGLSPSEYAFGGFAGTTNCLLYTSPSPRD